jgi:hypothetical protein
MKLLSDIKGFVHYKIAEFILDIIEPVVERIEELEDNQEFLINEISNSPTVCDKCGGSDEDCFKCDGTGAVQRKYLCGWPWEDV